MSEWMTDDPQIVKGILKRLGEEEKLPALVLQPDKLYKLKLLEDIKKVEGTDDGFMVRVRNEANVREYMLFMQRTLATKVKETGAGEGDTIAVVNRGRNMQTGYAYTVGHWDESLDRYLIKSFRNKKE